MTVTIRRQLTIINKLGLHARAAAKLVNLASSFDAELVLRREEREVNAKSIMGVMMLAASQGITLEVEATGEDASLAIKQLELLVAQRFGEPE
jgi:phosphocarrier protein HPr